VVQLSSTGLHGALVECLRRLGQIIRRHLGTRVEQCGGLLGVMTLSDGLLWCSISAEATRCAKVDREAAAD
jgi:hypothetical protein